MVYKWKIKVIKSILYSDFFNKVKFTLCNKNANGILTLGKGGKQSNIFDFN